MAIAARKPTSARAEVKDYPARAARQQKLPVVLITADDTLWSKIGADLSGEFVLKQVDSVAEFLGSSLAGHAAVLLWDARQQSDHAQVLSRLNLHAACCVVIALDEASGAGAWTLPLQHRQVMAHVALPITGGALSKALDIASGEARARAALLGRKTIAALVP